VFVVCSLMAKWRPWERGLGFARAVGVPTELCDEGLAVEAARHFRRLRPRGVASKVFGLVTKRRAADW
jgi:hypothetical protein